MRKFWIVFVIIAIIIGGGIGLLWKAATSLGEHKDSGGGGVLHWLVAGALPEEVDDSFLGQLQGGEQLGFQRALFALRRAAGDDDIKALVLEIDDPALSWAQLEELSAAVRAFGDSGKPVWAVLSFAGNGAYALASSAATVALVPEGNLMVMGVSAELAFMQDTLAKIGVDAEFLHVGEYKSAPEQYTRREASEHNRAMTRSLVDERYDQLVDLIAVGRGRSADEVRHWIDIGMYDGETALAAGMVDTLLDVDDLLAELLPDEDVTDFEDYALGGGRGHASRRIALVVAEGAIMPGESGQDPVLGKVMGSETVIEQLASAREDDDIEAVLLRVNSPGGSAMASDLIWREIERIREVKPVVVSMGGYAASGGYYISCNADSIFADRGTLTGSIGVFAGKADMSGLYDKVALHREFFTRGENALFWHNSHGFTDSQRALFQDQLDRFYARFVSKVAAGRGLEFEAVDRVARGRVWSGRQALDVGLVDGLGGISRALVSAKAMIGLGPDDKVRVETFTEEKSWLERAMLDALRSRGVAAGGRRAALAGLAEPWRGVLAPLTDSGLVGVLPLLDGRPVALMTWYPVSMP